jgi:ribonuclease Y
MEIAISAVLALLFGTLGGYFFKKFKDDSSKKSAQQEADRIVSRAKSEAARVKKESETKAKDFEGRARKNVETDIHKQRSQLKNKETQLERRMKEIEDQHKQKLQENDRFLNNLKDRDHKIQVGENRLKELESKAAQHIEEIKSKLEKTAAMTKEEARRELMTALEEEVKTQSAQKISQMEEETQKEIEKRTKKVLSQALSRFAAEYTSERTVSVMALNSDEMKGKIIGREGRNIRTLEALCGVDLIVDDTPEAVVISGFDPVRRELAKKTIEKLMEDGRVHPARIEEVVEKQRSELMKSIKEEGEKTVDELGVHPMNNELIKLVGSMKFRSSQAQNLLNHSIEVAYIAGLLAAELGVNVKTARRAGLLHDLGKVIDHTHEGSHAMVGAEMAKKYGEIEEVAHAIRSHHDEEKPSTQLAWIVQAANILSHSRPGSRRPQMENYIHRLENLESIGNSFDGVLKTFALQAGKEIRVLVESSRVTEDLAVMLSRDIARKIEREMPQSNSIKINVVRETRSVEMAR